MPLLIRFGLYVYAASYNTVYCLTQINRDHRAESVVLEFLYSGRIRWNCCNVEQCISDSKSFNRPDDLCCSWIMENSWKLRRRMMYGRYAIFYHPCELSCMDEKCSCSKVLRVRMCSAFLLPMHHSMESVDWFLSWRSTSSYVGWPVQYISVPPSGKMQLVI